MKAIMMMFDSLNRHHLPPYGNDWIHAPNFERLASRTVQFQNSYAGSLPCMPARRELHTGRYNFLHTGWGPLEPYDDSMPKILSNNGIYTHLCTDHYHYFEDGGATYHTKFNSWEFSRGQEGDPWIGQVREPEVPDPVLGVKRSLTNNTPTPKWRQDWVNRSFMTDESNQPQAKTFARGLDFIERNAQEDQWFLQLETFDPHEPFFTQQVYKDLYSHKYNGPHFDWPPYGISDRPSESDEHVKLEYAALVSMCDAYLGKLLDLMDELDLWKDTMLIVNTDHGFLLGEHNWWGKIVQPYYQEVAHTPLFIWDPRSGRRGVQCPSLVQTIDLPATLLDFFTIDLPADMLGIPLTHALAEDSPVHKSILFGGFGGHINCTDGHNILMLGPSEPDNDPLRIYTLMPSYSTRQFYPEELQEIEIAGPFSFTKGAKVMRLIPSRKHPHASNQNRYDHFGKPLESMLFEIDHTTGGSNRINDDTVQADLSEQIRCLLRENDAPIEQFERMGLNY